MRSALAVLRCQVVVTKPPSSTPMSGEPTLSVVGVLTGLAAPNGIVLFRAAVWILRGAAGTLLSLRCQTAVARPAASTAAFGLE